MVLSLFNHCAVLLLAEKRCSLACEVSARLLLRSSLAEQIGDLFQFKLCLVVSRFGIFKAHICDEDYLLTEIVKCYYLVEKHQVNVLEILGILGIDSQSLFGV